MSYKSFFFCLMSIVLFALSAKIVTAYCIDPIGIWGAPIIRGFNHYREKQDRYEDIFKPYEVIRIQPDIVYIGASQVDRGFSVSAIHRNTDRIYNMGIASGRLWDAREYLRFIYKTVKPKIVYFGINPGVFNKIDHLSKRKNFSVARLQKLAGNPLEYSYQIIKDSLGIHGLYLSTMRDSMNHMNDMEIFRFGWNSKGSNTNGIVSESGYYNVIGAIIQNHQPLEMSSDAVECLIDIVDEAQENNVKLCAFFTPVTVDLYAMFRLFGDEPEFQKIKRMASTIIPIYDFSFINELSTNRQCNFYDTGHFRTTVGEQILFCIEHGNPAPYGYLLTPETADEVFAKEDAAWEKWAEENQEYVNILKECIETGRKPNNGEFEKYIGF